MTCVEKRLAPVAVVLLLGLVAVPVLLAKPAEDPGPAPVAGAAPKKADRDALAALTKVKLGEDAVGKGSTLGVFDPDNPFKPPKGTIKKDERPGRRGRARRRCRHPRRHRGRRHVDSTAARSAAASAASVPGVTPPGTGGGGSTTTTTVYKYVVDLTFKANGRTRHIKGLEKLDMLPNDSVAAPDLHGRHGQGRRRGVPRGLDARGRRRGPLQAERRPSARSRTSAPAPSTSSPRRTATPTPSRSTRSAR